MSSGVRPPSARKAVSASAAEATALSLESTTSSASPSKRSSPSPSPPAPPAAPPLRLVEESSRASSSARAATADSDKSVCHTTSSSSLPSSLSLPPAPSGEPRSRSFMAFLAAFLAFLAAFLASLDSLAFFSFLSFLPPFLSLASVLASCRMLLHSLWAMSTISFAPHAWHLCQIVPEDSFTDSTVSGSLQTGHSTNLSMKMASVSCSSSASNAPLTMARSESASKRDCAPISTPRNLITVVGRRLRLLAMSTQLTTTVLMPLPRPSILLTSLGIL
mmetsp:Transcript_23333/g.55135  ORF Transcript_23333/g.55135 Transcript_23333/m.55135 type:complete len:276 (-) Transcript_23333:524-1351(-)